VRELARVFFWSLLGVIFLSLPTKLFAADDPIVESAVAEIITPGQSLATLHRVDVKFSTTFSSSSDGSAAKLILKNINSNGWNCYDPKNFKVTVDPGNGKAALTMEVTRIAYIHAKTCSDAFANDIARDGRLWVLFGWKSFVGKVSVQLVNLKDDDGTPLKNSGTKTPGTIAWTWSLVTASAQTAQNETLLDKTVSKNTIYQFPISSNVTIVPMRRGGFYVDTKDLFATNERDSKSAFQGGIGYQYGLVERWAIPIKVEGDMLGNQVASNLAAQISLQVSTTPEWTNRIGFRRVGPAWNVAPALTVALPYIHRINQYTAPGSTALPVNDFGPSPTVALTRERLVEVGGNGTTQPPTFALYWEADLGMFYLPWQRTSKGTQRAEGSGDASFLIPLSDFQIFRGLTLDPTTQVSQMQIRVKYQDTVDPTNNYTRTKGWTFGLELSVNK
jgi:hypothetical protein